jgi:putative DNA primase/helicase
MIAADIAAILGCASRSGKWWRCRCPVHHSHGATLSLLDGDRGLLVKCFAGCARDDILAELYRRGLLSTRRDAPRQRRSARSAVTPASGADTDDAARIAAAMWYWNTAQEALGTPISEYLAGRGITIDLPPSLRWAVSQRRLDGTYGPAMLALVEHVNRGPVAIHQTWIGPDQNGIWRRINRACFGPVGGGAVRLAPAAETLMVGEGNETCLAAMQATGMPAWAALSTSGLKALMLPPVVQHVIILADHDENGVGQRAARIAAQRWQAEGREVKIAMPPTPGTDMADVLVGCHQSTFKELTNVAA